jgi:hypothetical protein
MRIVLKRSFYYISFKPTIPLEDVSCGTLPAALSVVVETRLLLSIWSNIDRIVLNNCKVSSLSTVPVTLVHILSIDIIEFVKLKSIDIIELKISQDEILLFFDNSY